MNAKLVVSALVAALALTACAKQEVASTAPAQEAAPPAAEAPAAPAAEAAAPAAAPAAPEQAPQKQ